MARSDSKKKRLLAHLAEKTPSIVDESLFQELKTSLAPVSDGYLRRLLRGSGIPLSPLVDGVRHDTICNLETSLLALAHIYVAATNQERATSRDLVIQAKDRIRWALKDGTIDGEQRAAKQEMLLWSMTWLENPNLFPLWLSMRRRHFSPAE